MAGGLITSSIIGAIGSVIKGVFGLKDRQADVIENAIKVVDNAQTSTAKEVAAIASIISSEAQSENVITSAWRPLLMLLFGGMLASYWFFGYLPPHIDKMPPMMEEIFGLLKLGIGGYLGGRTIEKIIKNFNLTRVVRQFIDKKIL